MNKKLVGILAIATTAGAAIIALTQSNPGQVEPPVTTAPQITVTASPTPIAEYKPCYYVWATQALPEISADFQTAVQAILPQAEARANAYGENCVAEDGSFTFGAMETDFYVTLPVADLTDSAALGEIAEQILTLVIEQFPRPIVPGPNDGFVEFTFLTGGDSRVLRVRLPAARELLEKDVSGAELIQAMENQ